MPEVTYRRIGELLRELFKILLEEPDGLPAREALARLAKSVKLTEFELGFYETGGQRFNKILRFATLACAGAGWFVKNKGTWSVTDAGEKAYQTFSNPEQFCKEAFRLYRLRKASLPGGSGAIDSGASADVEAEKVLGITFEQAEEQAWTEIEQYLREMPPFDFQECAADLLRAMGYFVTWVAPRGKDGGVDIIAYTDALGTRAPRIKVQVKRTVAKVTTETLKAFMEIIGDEDAGLYISTSGYTKDAEWPAPQFPTSYK